MTNMSIKETITKIKPTNILSAKTYTRSEIIEISSDDDSDIEERTASSTINTTTREPMRASLSEDLQIIKASKPVLRYEFHNQTLPHTDAQQRKRQKINHNEYASPTTITGKERQENAVVPPLPELPDTDLDFDPSFLLEQFINEFPPQLDTNTAYTIFPPFVELEPTTENTATSSSIKAGSKPPVRKKTVCPYYEDPRWKTLMFCGSGHEEFPVVFGTYDNHEQIRQKWDSTEAAKVKNHAVSTNPIHMGERPDVVEHADEEELGVDRTPSETEISCFLKVRQVLPDIDQDFVVQIIRLQTSERSQPHFDLEIDISGGPSIDRVIETILEKESYPKAKNKPGGDPHNDDLGKTVPLVRGDSKSWAYTLDSIGVLAAHFDRIPTYEISKILAEHKWLYDTVLYLERAEEKYHTTATKPYKRLQEPRTELEKKYRSYTQKTHTNLSWRNLINEFQAAMQHVAREHMRAARVKEDEESEAKNLASHKESGNIVECRCCFDEEVPLNRAVMCEDTDALHWFCFSCVKNLAATQLGMMRYDMFCMDGSGCKAPLSKQSLVQAVPTKILDNLDLLRQQAEILAAGITLEQCPHCDFRASCEDSVFRCQNPACGRFTCRGCQQDAHAPKNCEEAKADKSLSARHVVEEARSEATMRECPKCKIKIIKESGCNKIICTKCACMSCYICRKDITAQGYKHFQPAPGQPDFRLADSTSTCKLYSQSSNGDEADADNAEKEVIEQMRVKDPNLNEEEVRIGTGNKKKKMAKTQTERQLHPENDIDAIRRHHIGLLPMPRMPRAPGILNDFENRIAGFAPPLLDHLRPIGNVDQGIGVPRLNVNNQAADNIPPLGHAAVLATARRIRAAVGEQQARRRKKLERAEQAVLVDQNNDRPRGNLGANAGMNLDGAFDYEPIQYPQLTYTNPPPPEWHQIHGRFLARPAVENRFDGLLVGLNHPALHQDIPEAPFGGIEWREPKLYDETAENKSIYEDALEML